MDSIIPQQVEKYLRQWIGKPVYVHLEVNPGAYWRNGAALLENAHVKGNGPYRVFLELDGGQGLIHIDDVTHMQLENETVIVIGFDEHERLARTVEVSLHPFKME